MAGKVLLAFNRVRRQRENPHPLGAALDGDEIEFDEARLVEPGGGLFADNQIDVVLLGQAFEARRQVYRVAEQRIVELLV